VSRSIYSNRKTRRSPATDQTPYLTYDRRHQSKDDMVRWAMERTAAWERPVHMVIKLVTDDPTRMWKRMLRLKVGCNRAVHGGYWYEENDDSLMRGIVLFEKKHGYLHIHSLVNVPAGGDLQTILRSSWTLFGAGPEPTILQEPDAHGNLGWVARTKDRGEVWMREVSPTDEDRHKVVDYILKELNYEPDQYVDINRQWRVLEQPCRRR
jgi:hypothetical protein